MRYGYTVYSSLYACKLEMVMIQFLWAYGAPNAVLPWASLRLSPALHVGLSRVRYTVRK